MGYEYERVSDIYIEKSIHPELKDQLVTPCYNLSTVLSDYDGKISPSNAQKLSSSMLVVSPGVVMSGSPDVSDDIVDKNLGIESYVSEVSGKAFELYTKYVSNDPEVVLIFTGSSGILSPLLFLSKDEEPLVYNAINSLYLDVMALYLELLKFTPNRILDINKQDLYRMDGNIRWITSKIENSLTRPYELLEVLRDLQRNLMTIRNISQLFYTTYYSSLEDVNFIGEV